MHSFACWLLTLFAVLVPATATVATAVMCPNVSVSKSAVAKSHSKSTDQGLRHATLIAKRAAPVAGQKIDRRHDAAAGVGQDKHCDDGSGCSQCLSCGSGSSLVAVGRVAEDGPDDASAYRAGASAPVAEFLLPGLERPPRTS